MGGIAGIVKLDGSFADRQDLERAQKLLLHRGTNKKGIHLDRETGMAHNRMAILDITDAANQPMSDMGERYWISFDGELYNFIELRKELKASGYRFKSESDTEVALAAFVAWGAKCFNQFNGIWALAVWDSEERVLTLSRDPFGFKPLYLYQNSKQVAYSSEVKGFLGFESIELVFNADTVAALYHSPSIAHATEITPWENVFKVLPGHVAQVDADKGDVRIEKWWHPLRDLPEVPADLRERKEKFSERFSQACKLRMRADIPIGFCVSGGLVSASIWEMAQRLSKDSFERISPDCKTASLITFAEDDQQELRLSEELVKKTKGRIKEFKAHSEDYVKNILDLIYVFESLEDLSVERWLLYRSLTQNAIHLTLDGLGANELLGRYSEGIIYHAFDQIKGLQSAKAALKDPYLWKTLIKSRRLPKMTKSELQESLKLSDFERKRELILAKGQPASVVSPYWSQDYANLIEKSLFFQAKYFYMLGGPLQRASTLIEAAAAAQGMQVRLPFLDTDLFRYCLSLPAESAISEGRTQVMLREAMRGQLPDSVVNRKIQRVLAPVHKSWFATLLKGLIQDCASSFSFRNFSVFNGKEAAELVKQDRFAEAWPYVQTFLLNERFREVREELFPD